jgi:hypothetical protein
MISLFDIFVGVAGACVLYLVATYVVSVVRTWLQGMVK